MPRLKRGRSSDVHVWEDCANSESREDPLIEQAKHESSGSAIAQISLLRSLSSASSNALEQSISGGGGSGSIPRTKRRNHSVTNNAEARPAGGPPKRPRLERSWSTQARIETTSALSQRHNMQQGRTAAAASYPAGADKPKLIISYDHRPSLSQLAWESDKENCSPDEDGNPRPFRRTLSNHTTASGRRRLPTAAPSSSSNWADKTGGRNPRRQESQSQQHRHPASLTRSATSPSSWSTYSKQFQTTTTTTAGRRRRSPNKSMLIYEDDADDGHGGNDNGSGSGGEGDGDDDRRQFFERDDVHRFMAGEGVSPSKKKEVDAAANLIALKFAR
jgi:hypothetical protein